MFTVHPLHCTSVFSYHGNSLFRIKNVTFFYIDENKKRFYKVQTRFPSGLIICHLCQSNHELSTNLYYILMLLTSRFVTTKHINMIFFVWNLQKITDFSFFSFSPFSAPCLSAELGPIQINSYLLYFISTFSILPSIFLELQAP